MAEHTDNVSTAGESGHTWIDSTGILKWEDTRRGWWVPVRKIRLIAEYTTEEGPAVPDWFVLFVRDARHCYEAPADARGMAGVLESIGKSLQCRLERGFCSSTDFRSRILYPANLADHALFTYESCGFWGWAMGKGRMFEVHSALTPEVIEFLRSTGVALADA